MLKVNDVHWEAIARGARKSFHFYVVKEADYPGGWKTPHEGESDDWPAICNGVFQSREETCPA
jgi:hypothetical protein